MGHTIIYVHGAGAKPDAQSLGRYWHKALAHSMERSHPNSFEVFNDASHEFVYYGDLTNAHLESLGKTYDAELDIADRNNVLDALAPIKGKTFGSRRRYEQLPGRSLLGELLADVGMPLARALGVSDRVITRILPELAHYWQDADNGSTIRGRIQEAIRSATVRRDEIALIAHCMGSVAAFDALWELTYSEEFDWYHGEKVNLWITLGSPLGDETVKSHLFGAGDDQRRYPGNIVRWVNFSAEDDYVSHDNAIRNDFEAMLKDRRLSHIEDHRIFNYAVRYGKSNPHSVAGYLIHPRVARSLHDWLT
ncbi:MAG: hypothetical protein E2O54_12485 [Gammaproteobacteria bacterium]|nr:MAG: hypothetical protein E2O58_03080 [Gammaproteobacteria bacterium]TDJ38718.1 MAG: hypothetical protein E2O54_12485 [Gammaproteobacteria bacterium]